MKRRAAGTPLKAWVALMALATILAACHHAYHHVPPGHAKKLRYHHHDVYSYGHHRGGHDRHR